MQRPRPILALTEILFRMAGRIGRQTNRAHPYTADERRAMLGVQEVLFHLRRLDCVVVAEAWQDVFAPGDIDLIAWEGDTLCFIEVKTRGEATPFAAEFLVDHDKQQAILKLGDAYLRQLPWKGDAPPAASVRFDVASVYLQAGGRADVRILRDAFPWPGFPVTESQSPVSNQKAAPQHEQRTDDMTLMNAPEYDARRANLFRNLFIGGGVLIALTLVLTLAGFVSGHGWLFTNLLTERRVDKFFTAIETGDFPTAYGYYQADADWQKHPEKYSGYTLKRFTEDWTKYSPVGPIHSHHVDKSVADGSGAFGTTLLVATTINGEKSKRLFLAVQRSDGTFSYPAPHVFEY